jgi:hypothetical protein
MLGLIECINLVKYSVSFFVDVLIYSSYSAQWPGTAAAARRSEIGFSRVSVQDLRAAKLRV